MVISLMFLIQAGKVYGKVLAVGNYKVIYGGGGDMAIEYKGVNIITTGRQVKIRLVIFSCLRFDPTRPKHAGSSHYQPADPDRKHANHPR